MSVELLSISHSKENDQQNIVSLDPGYMLIHPDKPTHSSSVT